MIKRKDIANITHSSMWRTKFAKIVAIIMLLGVIFFNPSCTNAADSNDYWVGTWATSPLIPAKLAQTGFENTTLRMIINPHIDGEKVRIRLTNFFGSAPVTFNKATIANQQNKAAIIPGTENPITFNGGQIAVTIQPGAEVLSDPVNMKVSTVSNLAISLYSENATGPATWHNVARQNAYISTVGDHTLDIDAGAFTKATEGWFYLRGVEVAAADNVKGELVTFGDSITDGTHSTGNANHRYPDYLAERIRTESPDYQLAVLNEGIAGNRILVDGSGTKGVDRFSRDVLSHEHLKAVIYLLGINDIGHQNYNPESIINGIKEIIGQAHEKGVKIYGATILPYAKAGYWTQEGQDTRDAVNEWIRTSNAFDGVFDFDAAMRNPTAPQELLPEYDSGDHLHPSDAGYKRMANTVDLSILKK